MLELRPESDRTPLTLLRLWGFAVPAARLAVWALDGYTSALWAGQKAPAHGGFPESLMSTYSTNEFKTGLKILIDGDPFSIVENEMVKPGKGQAFNRVKVRNLKTGRVVEKTWKSGDSVDAADVVDADMQYLYTDGSFWTFMATDGSFEQFTAGKSAMGDSAQWLKDGVECIVTLWNGEPLNVTAPAHVELKIVETDPGVRGDTATGGQKPAKLETGAVVRVPLFISEGEIIRVDTRNGEYISRAK